MLTSLRLLGGGLCPPIIHMLKALNPSMTLFGVKNKKLNKVTKVGPDLMELGS